MASPRKKDDDRLARELLLSTAFSMEWMKLDEPRRRAVEEWLATFRGKAPKEPKKIFISWCESNPKNSYLVEELLDPFLTALGFDVHYYKKDKQLGTPEKVIWSVMDKCELFVSLYTKDEGESAAGNVIRETGRRLDNSPEGTILFHELGVKIESMTYPKVLCVGFSMEKHGKLLLDLLNVLKNNGLLEIHGE